MALLAVGAVVPRKGYDVLVAALADARRICPGGWTSPATAGEPANARAGWSTTSRASALPTACAARRRAPRSNWRALRSADLFVLASRFEGYGMAYAEAIAHGLPVVGTAVGAIPDTVPAGAGMLVPPDDVAALAAALRAPDRKPRERERLAAGARAATFPSWREQARAFAGATGGLA